MAPIAAGVAFAAVEAFGSGIASAEGGWWHVPGNRVTQLHTDEMVLPSYLAGGMRALVESGGRMPEGRQQQTARRGGQMVVNISANDSKSFHEQLRNPRSGLSRAMREAQRNFQFQPTRR